MFSRKGLKWRLNRCGSGPLNSVINKFAFRNDDLNRIAVAVSGDGTDIAPGNRWSQGGLLSLRLFGTRFRENSVKKGCRTKDVLAIEFVVSIARINGISPRGRGKCFHLRETIKIRISSSGNDRNY